MNRILIKNAMLVNEGTQIEGDLIINDSIIEKVIKRPLENKENENNFKQVIEAKGMLLMPGVIDDHVHFRDPGLTHKATINSESRAALAGGVTSIMDMPNTTPHTTTIEAWNDKMEHYSNNALVNYSCYFGASNNNVEMLPTLNRNEVCGIKLFMGASTGNMLVDRVESLKKIFSNTDILVATHCENQDLIRKNTLKYKTLNNNTDDLDFKYHTLIRSAEACYQSSKLAVELAKQCGTKLHILHLSTAKELTLLDNTTPLKEKKITGEACVGHLMFSDLDYKILGTKIKCNPAIKEASDRAAIRAAVNDNTIDVIATDHAPHLLADKEGGALKAASGIPTIQFSLLAMLQLADEQVFPITTVVEKMCHAPATLYEINKRGFIKEGYFADLILVKPTKWRVGKEIIESLCNWSPFENYTFNWSVEKTFVNGCIMYDRGSINESKKGSQLRFR